MLHTMPHRSPDHGRAAVMQHGKGKQKCTTGKTNEGKPNSRNRKNNALTARKAADRHLVM